MAHIVFSRHAMVRAHQRGIKLEQVDAILRYADMEEPRGDGCTSIWISRRELRRLGPSTPEGVSTDRLQGVTVLQGDEQVCVTIIRNRRSRAYRRNTSVRHMRGTRQFNTWHKPSDPRSRVARSRARRMGSHYEYTPRAGLHDAVSRPMQTSRARLSSATKKLHSASNGSIKSSNRSASARPNKSPRRDTTCNPLTRGSE
jgi:hypothetical protein